MVKKVNAIFKLASEIPSTLKNWRSYLMPTVGKIILKEKQFISNFKICITYQFLISPKREHFSSYSNVDLSVGLEISIKV